MSAVAFCRASAARIFMSFVQSPVALVRSQKLEGLYLFQLLPCMIHFQLHALCLLTTITFVLVAFIFML